MGIAKAHIQCLRHEGCGLFLFLGYLEDFVMTMKPPYMNWIKLMSRSYVRDRCKIGSNKAVQEKRMCFSCRFTFIVIFCFILISPSTSFASDQRERKRVLVIVGNHKGQAVVRLAETGIQEIFNANHDYRIEQYVEYLDLNRFSDKQYKRQLAAILSHKYAGRSIDVIISILPNGLDFLLEYGDEIFPGIPICILYCLANEPQGYEITSQHNWHLI